MTRPPLELLLAGRPQRPERGSNSAPKLGECQECGGRSGSLDAEGVCGVCHDAAYLAEWQAYADQLEVALRAQAEAGAAQSPLDREPGPWDHRHTYTPGAQVWVVRFDVWHPAVIVRTDFTDYIVRIPSLDQLITATSCMLRTRAALAQADAGGEVQ